MTRGMGAIGTAVLLFAGISGCGQPTVEIASAPSVDRSKYVLAEEPEGAVGVMMAREDAKDQDAIVLVGRIGGRKNPWIEGRSAFTLIDASITVVADGKESGDAQICMDDCCATLRADCTTLVKIVDDRGQVLPIDARELLDANPNDMVVIQGKVRRDDEGSFSITASGVYVRR